MLRAGSCLAVVALLMGTRQVEADVLVSMQDYGIPGIGGIARYDEVTGDFLGDFVPPAAGSPLIQPHDLAVGPDGNVYVVSWGNSSVLRYRWPSGEFLGSFTLGGDLYSIQDIAFAPGGDFYVATGAYVKKYNGVTGQFVGNFGPYEQEVTHMTFGPDGNLYASMAGGSKGAINRYNPSDGSLIDVFNDDFVYSVRPSGLAFGRGFGINGDLYAQVSGGNISDPVGEVRRFDGTTGAFLQIFAFHTVIAPTELAFGPDGDLYVNGPGRNLRRYNGETGALIGDLLTTELSPIVDFLFVPIPEPSSIVLMTMGALALLAYAWGRRGSC